MEPLHIKNNAWQYFFKGVLKEATAKSNLSGAHKKFSDVPKDSPFSRVLTALKYEVKAKCLARKVIKLLVCLKQWNFCYLHVEAFDA